VSPYAPGLFARNILSTVSGSPRLAEFAESAAIVVIGILINALESHNAEFRVRRMWDAVSAGEWRKRGQY
jgi:hypothetical protein